MILQSWPLPLFLKPAKEVQSDRASKKLKRIQNSGVAQVLVNADGESLHVNGDTSQTRTCQFCTSPHNYTSGCTKREGKKSNGYEYLLSIRDPGQEKTLRSRLSSLACPVLSPPPSYLDTLAKDVYKLNLVVHASSRTGVTPVAQATESFQGQLFCVSFLGADAEPIPHHDHVWISGSAMNAALAHTLVKKKFVFDETIFG